MPCADDGLLRWVAGPTEAKVGGWLRWVAGAVEAEPRLCSKPLEDVGSAQFAAFAWRDLEALDGRVALLSRPVLELTSGKAATMKWEK